MVSIRRDRVNVPSRSAPMVIATIVVGMTIPSSAGFAADDGGLGEFFRQQFGIGAVQTRPEAGDFYPEDRPLIVRPHRSKRVSRRPQAQVAIGPVAPVSIYQDTTLRPGDAVMTIKGIRVFLGGHAAPYTEADFASLPDAEGLPRQVGRALATIDKAPRG